MSIPERIQRHLSSWISSSHAEQPVLLISQNAEQQEEVYKLVTASVFPADIIIVQGEKEKITVAHIKVVRPILATRPSSGKRIVYIPHAEQLLPASANMLLKTLEESKDHTRFLLASPAKRSVLPTIQSRCVAVFLHSPRHIANSFNIQETIAQYTAVRASEPYTKEDIDTIAHLIRSYTAEHGSNPAIARVALRLKNYYRTERTVGANIKLAADALLASLAELRNTSI